MSIHIVFGKPGAGKTLYGTRKIINELRETRRHIITNFPLVLDRLNEYLQQRFPQENLCCLDRITILDDEKLKDFYEERGPNAGVDGVVYFLDEAQIPFNARDWASCDREVFNYLTQHRKKGDDVWAFTQHPGNLDKQFRSLAQDFRRLRNERLIKLGMFRGFDRFTCRHFDVEPSGRGEPYLIEKFPLDPEGVASCYDTAKGIGVRGNKADMGARAKGLTIGWAAAAVVLLSLSILVVPKLLASFVLTGRNPAKEALDKAPQRLVEQTTPASTNQTKELTQTAAPPALWVSGFAVRGDKVQVLLSDGRVLVEGEDGLSRVDRAGIVYGGKRISMKPIVERPRLQPQVVSEISSVPPLDKPVYPKARGSWRLDEDGVQRLVATETLGSNLGRGQ